MAKAKVKSSKKVAAKPKARVKPEKVAAIHAVKALSANETGDAEAAFNAHLDEANAIPKAERGVYRLVPDLAIGNVATAIKVLSAHASEMSTALPQIDVASLQALPSIALGAKFAALRAEQRQPEERIVGAKIAEARALRGKLLPVLGGLASSELIPAKVHADILAGRGVRDVANDCVAIPAAFAKYKTQIAGKHAASAKDLADCAAVGAWLQTNLKRGDAKKGPAPAAAAEVDDRNAFAALLEQRYERLEAVAHYFEGADWASKAPALNGRTVTPQPKAKATEKAPGDKPAS